VTYHFQDFGGQIAEIYAKNLRLWESLGALAPEGEKPVWDQYVLYHHAKFHADRYHHRWDI